MSSSPGPGALRSSLGPRAGAVLGALALALTAAPGASADSHENETAAAAEPTSTQAAPEERGSTPEEGWRYSKEHFFALTRGLEEEDLSPTARRWVKVLTVPCDVVLLPTAAIAGLYGT